MWKPWPFIASWRPIHTRFLHALGHYLWVVWPVLFAILAWQLTFGFLIAWIERWSLGDGVYFTFVTGLTIGYGDLVPHQPLSRFLALVVGFFGTVLTGLFAAIAVKALQTATDDPT
jgi:voltage-gated potassium channel